MNAPVRTGFRIARATVALGVLTLPVSGCLMAAPSAFQMASYAADGVSYATTGKTVTDHLVSEVTAKDCAMGRALKGEDICKEKEIERYPDGTPVPRADDVAAGVVPAGQDQEFQSFAVTATDASGTDDAENLDAPARRFDGFAQSDPQAVEPAPRGGREPLRVAAASDIAAEVRATPAPTVPVYTEGQPMPELDTQAETPAQEAAAEAAQQAAEEDALAAETADVAPAQDVAAVQNADPFADEDEVLDVQTIQQVQQAMGR